MVLVMFVHRALWTFALIRILLLALPGVCIQSTAMAQEDEAPPPQPSAAVRSLLQEAEKLLAARQSGDALHKIAEAGAAASARQDVAGEAMSRMLQARASIQLGKIDTAIQAMQAAAALWGAGGHGPEQIDVLI